MRIFRPSIVFGWLVLLPGVLKAGELESKNLFLLATKAPSVSYKGTRTIITWFGSESQAVEAKVYFKPPNLWRQEILNPQGQVSRVVIQNKEAEWIWEEESKTLIKRPALSLGNDSLLNWTLANYDALAKGYDEIMGRNAAIVELTPQHRGSPGRTVWVDPATGIVLKIKQANPDGSLVTEVHFTEIDVESELTESLFEPPKASQDQIIIDEPRPVVRGPGELPEGFRQISWIDGFPSGFHLTKATLMPLGEEEKALHFQYNDGLSVLSFFVSPRPIQAGPRSHQVVLTQYEDPGFITSTSAGSVLEWEQEGHYFLLVGELSQTALQEIMEFIRNRS